MSTSVSVRMYNLLNPGDCFLLRFHHKKNEVFVLLDFGSYEKGNSQREIEIANNIRETVGENPLIIALTHLHRDHFSGFVSAEHILKNMQISEIWLSHLEDPATLEAKAMHRMQESFWTHHRQIKENILTKFGKVIAVDDMVNRMDAVDHCTEDQPGEPVITKLMSWSQKRPRFLTPGQSFNLPDFPEDLVRVYVMGASSKDNSIEKKSSDQPDRRDNPPSKKLPELDSSCCLVLDALSSTPLVRESADLKDFPFDRKFSYPVFDPTTKPWVTDRFDDIETWRRIDHDWLSEMGRASQQMEHLTDQNSLVFAFELVHQQKVLLFGGDAQVADWNCLADLEFENVVSGEKTDTGLPGNKGIGINRNSNRISGRDLLSRTVLYKTGNHLCGNISQVENLDLMNDDELVIMIPMNEKISSKLKLAACGHGMLHAYNRKSKGRVLRSDTVFHSPKNPNAFKFSFADDVVDFHSNLKIENDQANESHLYVEYTIQ